MNPLRRLRVWRLRRQYVTPWDAWSVEDHELWETAIDDGLAAD